MRWESLQFEHYGIYQDEALGRFTEDPVHLVHFLHAKRSERAVDLGTGNGIVPLYANALYGCAFTGVDVDEAQLLLGITQTVHQLRDALQTGAALHPAGTVDKIESFLNGHIMFLP